MTAAGKEHEQALPVHVVCLLHHETHPSQTQALLPDPVSKDLLYPPIIDHEHVYMVSGASGLDVEVINQQIFFNCCLTLLNLAAKISKKKVHGCCTFLLSPGIS